MPQLDKVSFVTQYFWLTLFFFGLYFLTTNFFVILVFKNLKLRNIIYKIWYFFVYQFDYEAYQNKNKSFVNVSFNLVYNLVHLNLLNNLKASSALKTSSNILDKKFRLLETFNIMNSLSLSRLKDLDRIIIDEI